MKQNLQLRISQNLALTPQLQQSIRLLQLSSLELDQELEIILQDNPLLELVDGDNPDADIPEASLAETSMSEQSNGVDRDPLEADGEQSNLNEDFENDAFSNLDYQETNSTVAETTQDAPAEPL